MKIVRHPPGIALPGRVPSTYPPEPNPWDVCDSYRGGPPCGPLRGNRDMCGRRPSLGCACSLRALSNDLNAALREGFPALSMDMITEFLQIAWMSTPATERLKISVKKAKPCSPRWQRWSTVFHLIGGRARLPDDRSDASHVERPIFGVHAMVLVSSLMSLLMVRSWGTKQAVNFLLKARAIAFEQEWVCPSKPIEMFGEPVALLLAQRQ